MYRDNRTGEYPLYRHQVRERRPSVSLPAGDWTDEMLQQIEISLVRSTECPPFDANTQRCVEIEPIEKDGLWIQRWRVENLDAGQ